MISHNAEFYEALCPEKWMLESGRLTVMGAEWMEEVEKTRKKAEKLAKRQLNFKQDEEQKDALGNTIIKEETSKIDTLITESVEQIDLLLNEISVKGILKSISRIAKKLFKKITDSIKKFYERVIKKVLTKLRQFAKSGIEKFCDYLGIEINGSANVVINF